MKYLIQCQKCDCSVWIPGGYEPDTNATVLADNDSRWDEACEHSSIFRKKVGKRAMPY